MRDKGREPPLASGEPESSPESVEQPILTGGRPVDPRRLLILFSRHLRLLIVVGMIGCVAGYAAGKYLVSYEYIASAILEFQGQPEVDGMTGRGVHGFQTLIDSIRIPPNLRETNKRLKLSAPARLLLNRIDVDYGNESNVVVISGKGSSPHDAATFTNTLVDVFLEHCIKIERERLEGRLALIDSDLKLARARVNNTRGQYDSFRLKHRIADLSVEQRQAIEAAGDLQAAAALAQADARAEAVRLEQLNAAQRQQQAHAVISERHTSPQLEEIGEIRTKLAQARSSLSSEHPRVQALERQLSAVQSKSPRSTSVVSDRIIGINPTYTKVRESAADSAANREAALEREAALKALTKSARERVEQLSKVEGDASKLLADVRIAEEHVEELEARRTKVADVARTPMSGFRIAERAQPPDAPVRNRNKMLVATSVPLASVFIVLLFLCFIEFRGFKLHTPAEVCYWGNAPVIGASMWPRDAEALTDFISEFDDFTPYVGGSTLVVCAGEPRPEIAQQVTDRLREAFLIGAQSRTLAENEFTIEPAVDVQSEIVVIQPDGTEIPVNVSPAPETAALATIEQAELLDFSIPHLTGGKPTVEVWDGPNIGPQLRRAARVSDRVMVLVPAGEISLFDIRAMISRLGRNKGVGFALINLDPQYHDLPDRWGDATEFWYYYRA